MSSTLTVSIAAAASPSDSMRSPLGQHHRYGSQNALTSFSDEDLDRPRRSSNSTSSCDSEVSVGHRYGSQNAFTSVLLDDGAARPRAFYN